MSNPPPLERAAQDAANLATSSGLSGLGLFSLASAYKPTAIIDRTHTHLRETKANLKSPDGGSIPQHLHQSFTTIHGDLFNQTAQLAADVRKKGSLRSITLIPDACNLESQSEQLRRQVRQSSDYFAHVQPSMTSLHTIGSAYEMVAAEPEPKTPTAEVQAVSTNHESVDGRLVSGLVELSSDIATAAAIAREWDLPPNPGYAHVQGRMLLEARVPERDWDPPSSNPKFAHVQQWLTRVPAGASSIGVEDNQNPMEDNPRDVDDTLTDNSSADHNM